MTRPVRAMLLTMTVVVAFTIGPPANAAPGDLDPTFGAGGIVVPPAPQVPQSMHVEEAVVLSTGAAVAVGWTQPWPADPRLFVEVVSATGRTQITEVGLPWPGASALLAAARAPQDRVIAAGWARASSSGTPTPQTFLVARLLPTGALDRSYGVDGVRTTSMGGGAEVATGVVVDPAGRAIVVGRSTTSTSAVFALARYTAGGQLDRTFGSSGRAFVRFAAGAPTQPAIAMGPRGGLIIASPLKNAGRTTSLAVARLTPAGKLDRTFSGDGKTLVRFASSLVSNDHTEPHVDIAVQPDARIVVGLTLARPAGTSFALIRLRGGGALDPTFGGNGRVHAPFGPGDDELHSIALQPDGKILVGGGVRPGSWEHTSSSFALARFRPRGWLDPTFGRNGLVTTSVVPANDWIESLARLPDGRIFAAGRALDPDFGEPAYARYLGS